MGVDYYIKTSLEILYTNGEKDYIELSSEGRYYAWLQVSYDSDSEGDRERAEKEEDRLRREELAKHNDTKLMYLEGRWHITSQSKIELYEQLILDKQIKAEEWTDRFVGADVKSIEKVTYAIER